MNAPEAAVAVAALPLAHITPSPSNPRKHFDEAYLAEMAETIKSHGILQPITVRPNPHHKAGKPIYEIVVGECRWRAAKIAGLAEIPAFWRELDDKQVLEIQIVENLQRRDVPPLEEAEGYDRLMKTHGYQAEQIADKIGKSRSYVYSRLKLCALCKHAREAFFAGTLDASTALLVARINGEKEQKRAVKEIVEGYGGRPMSYRDAQRHLRYKFTLSLKQATFSPDDAALLPAAGACSACPKRSGNDRDLFGDIEEADVCTDPQCFEEKRLARHAQLIALAEKKKIPVLRDEAAEAAMPNGPWSLNEEHYVNLDQVPDGEAQGRTYREILGEKTPVSALIEYKRGGQAKYLAEVAEPKALEAALKKVGWKPQEAEDKTGGQEGVTDVQIADRRAKRERDEAEFAVKQHARAEEIERREALATMIFTRMAVSADRLDEAIVLLATIFLRQMHHWTELSESEQWLARWGFTLPEEYDAEEEISRMSAALGTWSAGKVLAFLFDGLLDHDRYGVDPLRSLSALAEFVGLDAEKGKNPAKAAPAAEKKPAPKKPKTKASPAPASPAEETTPAAPGAAAGTDTKPRYLKIGDRVRVKEGVKGPNGIKRKCCGREGTVEAIQDSDFAVRFGKKAHELVTNLRADELEILPPAALTEQAWPFPAPKPEEEKPQAAVEVKSAALNPSTTWPFPTGARP